MSAATMNGGDAVKSASPTGNAGGPATGGPKQQLKNNVNVKSLEGARKQASSPVDGQNRKQQPVKAWQGTNPITQRASTSVANGADKPLPKLPSQVQYTKSMTEANMDKQAHDRSLYLLAQFIGKDVTLNLKNGEQFTGIFSGGLFESSKSQYVLKMVKRTKAPSQPQANGVTGSISEYIGEGDDHIMTFDIQDTINLSAPDIVLASPAKQTNGSVGTSFLTDVQISSRENQMPRERELQRWEPEAGSSDDIGGLEDSGETAWDQFAANGLQTTYDETIYTTAIDRSNPQYRQRQAEADRIAREIEGSAPANAHIAEERRGDAARDDGLDEEEKYSGVRRETASLPKRTAGAYIPPSQRPITGVPTVPGAPFDPAIISTKLSQPAPSNGTNAERNLVQPSGASPPSGPELPKSTPEAAHASQATQSTDQAVKKPKEIPAEDYVRGTADAFKQFANNEKLKIRQAQEAKRSSARQEKNVKINDLKKFAANFKLKSRVPDDLVPILAKDRDKQIEIKEKAEEAAREAELRVKERNSEKVSAATSPSPSTNTAPHVAPSAPTDARNPHQHRQRPSQTTHPRQQLNSQQASSPRAPLHPRGYGRGPAQPQPADLRIPPPNSAADSQMSPSSATRFNVNAKSFEFRPGASTFQPSGSSPSPRREPPAAFFDKSEDVEAGLPSSAYNSFSKLSEANVGDETVKKLFPANGGLPQAYRTTPTWPVAKENDAVTYLKSFPKLHAPSSIPSPMPTPNPSAGVSHGHQIAAHIPGQPIPAPAQRQQFYPPPQPGHNAPFDPRFPHFAGPNGSVQNSPRAQSLGPVFNNQLPGMPMPQYPGQPVQGYGMSPSMQYRQLQGPGGPMMMMPGQSPAQLPMRPSYPQGPQFQGPQMGGHMMAHNPSGSYIGGPVPNQGYSPMPPHAQPHMPHQHQAGPAGYSSSSRPPMMQQQGSHQGYQPQMHMHPGFVPTPGQHHPYQMQRGVSGQFPQMTPRQQHALPQHPSPGMPGVGAQGDEGK